MSEFVNLVISANIRSSIEKVWACWTEAEHIVNWNFASEDWHCPKAENNLVVDGTFSFTMAAKDGSFSFDFEGKYTAVEPEKSISYVLGDGRKVKVEFTSKDGYVEVTEAFDAETLNPIDMQQAGWQAILNNFKDYAEKH